MICFQFTIYCFGRKNSLKICVQNVLTLLPTIKMLSRVKKIYSLKIVKKTEQN